MAEAADEEEKKAMDSLGFETKAFEALERDFQEVRGRRDCISFYHAAILGEGGRTQNWLPATRWLGM